MCVYCIEKYIYYTYSTYILYRSICPLLVQLYTTSGKVLNPLTPRKRTLLTHSLPAI